MTLTPRLRKFLLTAHITFSVGLIGSIAAFLALAVAGLTNQNEQTVRFAYPAMQLIAQLVIVPLAFASLLTGIVQSLGTRWGLFQHYWVMAKLLLTAFATAVLLIKMQLISNAAFLAMQVALPSADLRAAGLELVVHAAGGLMVLLGAAVLSMYKPRGLTPLGQRKQSEMRGLLQQPYVPSKPLSGNRVGGTVWPRDQSVTIMLTRASVLRFILFVVAAHIVVMHLVSGGLSHH
jgi:hypothetical protein